MIEHLACAFVKCAWVTEWLEEEGKLQALSFWVDSRYVPDYEYSIAGKSCEGVITDQCLVVASERMVELFLGDPDLTPLGDVSYMGQSLLDAGGKMLGNWRLCMTGPCSRQFLVFLALVLLLNLAGRVRRDRVLREREEKLSCIIDSAMNSIIENDAALKVAYLSRAGADCFHCNGAAVVGRPLQDFFTPANWG